MRRTRTHQRCNIASLVRNGGVAAQYFSNVGTRLEGIPELQLVGAALWALVRKDSDNVDAGGTLGGGHGAVVEEELDGVVGDVARVDVDGVVADGVEGGGQGVELGFGIVGGGAVFPEGVAVEGGVVPGWVLLLALVD